MKPLARLCNVIRITDLKMAEVVIDLMYLNYVFSSGERVMKAGLLKKNKHQ